MLTEHLQNQEDREYTEQRHRRIRNVLSIVKLLLLLCIMAGVPLYLYFQLPDIWQQFKTVDSLNAFLEQYRIGGAFVYLGLQVVQVLVAVLPGQFVQFAGGYAYGVPLAFPLAVLGIALGTTAAFFLSRFLGTEAMHLLFGEERISRFVHQLNSKKAFIILLLLFLIPGIPKDLITYAAGVSRLHFLPFLALSLIGRSPALLGSTIMGDMMRQESYAGAAVLFVIAAVLFCIGLWKRQKILHAANKLYERMSGEDRK